MTIKEIVIVYLVVINVATFLTYGIVKWKAKKSLWRIREASLLDLAVLGGSIGNGYTLGGRQFIEPREGETIEIQ